MRFKTASLALLCFFLYHCNGSPGDEDKKKQAPLKYTDEEKKFVYEEILTLLDDFNGISNKKMWDKVAQKHQEKFRQKTTGFPQERSSNSLRVRFHDDLKNYQTQNEGILPENLIQKLTELDQLKTKRGLTRIQTHSYTKEEEKLIMDVLLEPSSVKICGASTLKAIQASLDKNHRAQVPGFERERTYGSVRGHMRWLTERGEVPSEIKRKFSLFDKGASSSNILSQNEQTDVQVNKRQAPRCKYTDEENEFVIGEVLRIFDYHRSINSRAMWQKVAKKHLEKWKQKTNGFPQERSAESLRVHFQETLRKYQSQSEVILPDNLMRKLTLVEQDKIKRGLSRIRYSTYSREEEKLIFDELLDPSCQMIFGASTLNAIKAKLDKNHQDKVHGFECERTISSIRLQLCLLRGKGRFPSEVIRKFPLLQKDVPSTGTSNARSVSPAENLAGASSSYIPSQDQYDLEILNDDEWTAEMINDLLNDDACAYEEQDNDDAWIAEMIEELSNKDVDFDYTELDKSDQI